MPDLDHQMPRQPAEWPHQVRAAAALALIGAVWLAVLPFAATAYVVVRLGTTARGALAQNRLKWK